MLGNGATVAVHPKFHYTSLKEEARTKGYLSVGKEDLDPQDLEAGPVDAEGVFQLLGTDDFELVLNILWHAKYVNEALSVEEEKSRIAYELVRQALVETVHAVHPERQQVEGHLKAVQEFMKRFDIVLSLNYDLIAYWALLAGNKHHNYYRFKDCFKGDRTFDADWARHRSGGGDRSTLVFYPHGNLASDAASAAARCGHAR